MMPCDSKATEEGKLSNLNIQNPFVLLCPTSGIGECLLPLDVVKCQLTLGPGTIANGLAGWGQ